MPPAKLRTRRSTLSINGLRPAPQAVLEGLLIYFDANWAGVVAHGAYTRKAVWQTRRPFQVGRHILLPFKAGSESETLS